MNAKIVDEYGIICSFGQLQATLYVYHCRVETERVICLEQAVVGMQPLHVGACPVQPGHECVYVSLLGCCVLWASCHKTVKPLKVGLGGSRDSLCQCEYTKSKRLFATWFWAFRGLQAQIYYLLLITRIYFERFSVLPQLADSQQVSHFWHSKKFTTGLLTHTSAPPPS